MIENEIALRKGWAGLYLAPKDILTILEIVNNGII